MSLQYRKRILMRIYSHLPQLRKICYMSLLLLQHRNNGHNVLDIRVLRNGCHYLPALKKENSGSNGRCFKIKHMGDIVTCLNKILIKI